MEKALLKIEGMHWASCVKAVQNALTELPGVSEAMVKIGEADVTYDGSKLTLEQLQEAIDDAGYEVLEVAK